jgi:predicted aconitase with swiveling domain
MGRLIQGIVLVAAEGRGQALMTSEPLSFWGGYDQITGEIIDRRHPLSGQIASGRVLGVPGSRGSSTTTAVLLEAVRRGTAPAAILTTSADSFLALASIVADELYQRPVPVVALALQDFVAIETGMWVSVHDDGRVEVESAHD